MLASHIVGLIKTRLLISVFFGSKASLLDVYYAAFVIPDTLFQLLGYRFSVCCFYSGFYSTFGQKRRQKPGM